MLAGPVAQESGRNGRRSIPPVHAESRTGTKAQKIKRHEILLFI